MLLISWRLHMLLSIRNRPVQNFVKWRPVKSDEQLSDVFQNVYEIVWIKNISRPALRHILVPVVRLRHQMESTEGNVNIELCRM